jgi:hypothetical protein
VKQKLLIVATIVGLEAAVTAFGQQPVPGDEMTVETFVHNLDSGRYKLVKKKHNQEWYVDKVTGERWRVEVHRAGKGE